jgi:amidase
MTGITIAPWQQVAAAKQAARDALIPSEWLLPRGKYDDLLDVTSVPATCGILSPSELKITESSADVILARVREGAWTAVGVTTAFCKRAAIAQQLVSRLPIADNTRLKMRRPTA